MDYAQQVAAGHFYHIFCGDWLTSIEIGEGHEESYKALYSDG